MSRSYAMVCATRMVFSDEMGPFVPDSHLNPITLRRIWQHMREQQVEVWHNTAQRLAMHFSGGNLEKFQSFLNDATPIRSFEQMSKDFRELRLAVIRCAPPGYDFDEILAEIRLKLLEQATQINPTKAVSAAEKTLILHEVELYDHSVRGREEVRAKFREKLAAPMRVGGPKTRDDCDELFSQLYEASPWLSDPLTYLWQSSIENLETTGLFRTPPVILAGPPGCGKTYLATRLGTLAKCAPLRLDMSSATAAFMITGSEYTWSQSDAGRPIEHIVERGVANPVIVLDELDKRASDGRGGDAAMALLPLLQPDTAAQFQSPYLGAAVDMSHVSWVICVNDPERLPAPLLDRACLFNCTMPTGTHLKALVNRVLGADAAPDVVAVALDALSNGKSLRWLERAAIAVRAVANGPVYH